MKNPLDLLIAAGEAARLAGEYLRTAERPEDPSAWSQKGPSDFVTAVDRECERIISGRLTRDAPASRVVGEELAPDVVKDGLVWIVDPLDGTTNFLHGYPEFAVSIAVVERGVLAAGVV
ncbi:MAG: inositol monophosphatase family protein, partial [Gemmatimonadales bacterium]